MRRLAYRMWRDERGQDLVEYGIILVLVAVAVVATLGTIGSSTDANLQNVTNKL